MESLGSLEHFLFQDDEEKIQNKVVKDGFIQVPLGGVAVKPTLCSSGFHNPLSIGMLIVPYPYAQAVYNDLLL